MRGFLGLNGYYRRFIKGYSTITSPLTELFEKDAFSWSMTAEQAFHNLKTVLSSAPVLALPDFQKPFLLKTDASWSAIGAGLSQDGDPIAYFSKKLSPRM